MNALMKHKTHNIAEMLDRSHRLMNEAMDLHNKAIALCKSIAETQVKRPTLTLVGNEKATDLMSAGEFLKKRSRVPLKRGASRMLSSVATQVCAEWGIPLTYEQVTPKNRQMTYRFSAKVLNEALTRMLTAV